MQKSISRHPPELNRQAGCQCPHAPAYFLEKSHYTFSKKTLVRADPLNRHLVCFFLVAALAGIIHLVAQQEVCEIHLLKILCIAMDCCDVNPEAFFNLGRGVLGIQHQDGAELNIELIISALLPELFELFACGWI